MTEKIVEFKAWPEGEPRVRIKPTDYLGCKHRGVLEINRLAHRVICDNCKAVMDPITVLVDLLEWFKGQKRIFDTIQKHRLEEHEKFKAREAKRDERRRKREENAQGHLR